MTRALPLFPFLVSCLAMPLIADEPPGNLPPDPFSNIRSESSAPGYPVAVDRGRGSFVVAATADQYQSSGHFSNWLLETELERPGSYLVGLRYRSSTKKMGIQIKAGDAAPLKGYAPRTVNGEESVFEMGVRHFAQKGKIPLQILAGDESNTELFRVSGVTFTPAPKLPFPGQEIDGSLTFDAANATTFSTNMHYEEQPNKQCLGFWTDADDWAEWTFSLEQTGDFDVFVSYGCNEANAGSEVMILLNDQSFEMKIEDTGGFQEWKRVSPGSISLSSRNENKLAVVPKTKTNKAVLDIRRIELIPKK